MAVYEQTNKDGSKSWYVDFSWEDQKTGKKRRIRRAALDPKGRPAKSQTAAEKHEDRLRVALASGTYDAPEEAAVPSTAPTLKDFVDNTYLPFARAHLKAQTLDNYTRTLRRSVLPALRTDLGDDSKETFGSTPIDKVSASVVATLSVQLHQAGLAAKTINNYVSVLHTVLEFAAEHGHIQGAPSVRWQRLPPATFDFFTFEEAARLIPVAVPLVVVAVRTGMRIGELLELKWSDISLERKTVTVARSVWWDADNGKRIVGSPKNGKARTIPLSVDARAALESLPDRAGYVFCDRAALPLTPSQCKWPIWRSEDAAELRRTGPHMLRHTFASHLVMKGVPLPAVQALMGHGTIQMTMKYAHLAPDHLRTAIEMLDAVPGTVPVIEALDALPALE
jgi:integrase